MFSRTWRAACCAAFVAGVTLAQPPERNAAVVNGVAITVNEVEAELKQAPLALPAGDAQRRLRQMEALGLLIDKLLFRQFLDKQVGNVVPEELNKKLVEFEASLLRQDRKISLAEFAHDTNQSAEQIKAGLGDHLRWNAFVADKLTDAYLEGYYQENRDFFDKVSVRASHIALRVAPGAAPADKERLRASLVELRQRLLTDPGCDFAEMARKHSTGPQAGRGGDVGHFTRLYAVEEPFAKAAFALKVGDISDVVETAYGLHLIKVTDRTAGEPSDFPRMKETVRAHCSEDLRQGILMEQRKAAAAAIKIELP